MLPFYLHMMGLNALDHGVASFELASVARSVTDDEVVVLLGGAWRMRVMGAWFAAGRSARLADPLTDSLASSAGASTAQPLIAVLAHGLGARAVPAVTHYRDRDLENSWGAAGFAAAALEYLAAAASEPEAEQAAGQARTRQQLQGMLAIARNLAALAPA